MINATPLAPLALPPNLPPSSCFAPLLPLDAADSHAATALSPAQQEFSSLQAWLSAPRTLQLPLHQVECQQEQKGRALQRLLLQAHLQQRGPGDVGRALYVNQDGQKPTLYSHRRLHTRVLKTIFGPIQIQRMGYCRAGTASIHPLDETLQLPARSFSYELQKRMVKAAVQGTFRETGERIAEITRAQHRRSPSASCRGLRRLLCRAHTPNVDRYGFDSGSGRRRQGHSHDQARRGTTGGTTDQGTEGQPQEDGHGGRGVHTSSVDSHSPAGGGKPFPQGANHSRWREPASTTGAQAGVGQPHQRQGCRDWRGGRRGATPRSARPQDPRGPHRWRARPADSRQQESSGHPHSRSAPRVGKTLESRLRVPCRR